MEEKETIQTNEDILRNFLHNIYDIRRCLENIIHFNNEHFTLVDFTEDYSQEISENYRLIHSILNKMYIKSLKGLCVIAKQNVEMAFFEFPKYDKLCFAIKEERERIEKLIDKRT